MSQNIFDTLKVDAENAAYRVAANKSSEILKNSLVSLIEKKVDSESAKAFAAALDTDFGLAFINMLMGVVLNYAPGLNNHKNAQRLAQEFRINGMATAGNAVLDEVFSQLLPGVMQVVQTLPKENVRIEQLSDKTSVDDLEENNKNLINVKVK